MKGVVFGRGFLGKRVSEELGYDLLDIDITDANKLREYFSSNKPDVAINCAGMTGRPNIDWCETHESETIMSNVVGAIVLGSVCSEKGVYFVHLGSGSVYCGDNGGKGYSEQDEPNHLESVYIRTKIYSEKVLSDMPCLQARLIMPIDEVPNERNFIDKVRKYPSLIDEQNSMSCVPDFLMALRMLIDKRAHGIYNVTNPGTISAVEIMTMYKEIVDPSVNFKVISAGELKGIVKAKRTNCVLNTDKLGNDGINLPDIHDAVKSCLINYKKALNKGEPQ